jgi:P2 family phage contractile tail tube protein
MAGISVNRITNANVYLNGGSLLGKAESIDLPTIKHKMADHKALGMVGTLEFPAGIEKLESKIKWNSFYSDAMKAEANPTQTVQLQCRGSILTWAATGVTAEVPLVCLMTALFKKFDGGKFKQHDNVERESDLAVYYFKITSAGEEILELDVMSNIYRVAGKDVLDKYRINIGG